MTLRRSGVFGLTVCFLTILSIALCGSEAPAQQSAGNGAQNTSAKAGTPPAIPAIVTQNVLLSGCVLDPSAAAGYNSYSSVAWQAHSELNTGKWVVNCPSPNHYVSVWTADSSQKQFDYVRSELKWELVKAVDDELVQSKVVDNAISANLMSRPDLQQLIDAAVQKSSDDLEKKFQTQITAMQKQLEAEIQAARHPATQHPSSAQ